jgi:hypothetical protein
MFEELRDSLSNGKDVATTVQHKILLLFFDDFLSRRHVALLSKISYYCLVWIISYLSQMRQCLALRGRTDRQV